MLAVTSYNGTWAERTAMDLSVTAAAAAQSAISALLGAFGNSTEPDFSSLGTVYDRMLAISLLLAGCFIACALIEAVLGGGQGAGWSVIPRTLLAVFFAFCGLGLATYVEHYAALLAGAWAVDYAKLNSELAALAGQYAHPDFQHAPPLGSAIGLLLTALFTVLIGLLIYMELFARMALLLIGTSFIPLVAVMSIWPRLAPAAAHLAEFLLGLALSKFVVATAIFIGFDLLLPGLIQPGNSEGTWMIAGVAILLIAAFSPVVLVRGLRFTHSAAGTVARSLGLGVATALPLTALPAAGLRAFRTARAAAGGRRRSPDTSTRRGGNRQ